MRHLLDNYGLSLSLRLRIIEFSVLSPAPTLPDRGHERKPKELNREFLCVEPGVLNLFRVTNPNPLES